MDERDRLFAEIAERLELLTREQLHRSVEHARKSPGTRLGEAAVALGFMSSDEVGMVRLQEARAQQRKPNAPAKPAVSDERVERVDARADPRADARVATRAEPRADARRNASSRPKAAATEQRSPAKKSRGQAWAPTEDSARGAVRISPSAGLPPPTEGSLKSVSAVSLQASRPPMELADTAPGDVEESLRPPRPRAQAQNIADTEPILLDEPARAAPPAAATAIQVPQRLPAPPPAEPAFVAPLAEPPEDVDAFPLAQGDDRLRFSERPVAEQSSTDAEVSAQSEADAAAPSLEELAPTIARAIAAAPHPEAPAATRPADYTPTATSYLGKALALAMHQGGSDLHVHSGVPLMVRVDGQLRVLSAPAPLRPEAAERVIAEQVNDAQWIELGAKGQVDFALELKGIGRFRVNVYRQQRGLDAVFRIISEQPPTLQSLGLPARLSRLTDYRTGLVLCTGPTGSGKSSTLAALLAALVKDRAEHIITVEDPVEYVLPQGKSLVNQRQVRDHTSSFARALRAALREDPDVVAITELRDRETISLAMSAAETGHLVLGTMQTGTPAQTIYRMVGSFAPEEREQMRVMLSESLRAVVSQRLLPRATGSGRVPAIELMMVNMAISSLIREDKIQQLPSVMQTGKAAGMITLDDSLHELVQAGTVTAEAARRFAVRKERFT